ncbi:hypothetical protein NBRC116585_15870 [Thalassolituus maritimus]|uniref:Uncharacterized protein n=1 Tax=Thalassolituus maritimus TaxID=484498 RepID=A0ABP9ZZ93_9GAMM
MIESSSFLRNLVCAQLCLFILAPPSGAADVQFGLSAEASSEPVPIDQMIEGWEKDARSGEYAFADMALTASASYRNFTLIAERRWFYSLTFSPDTTAVYLDAEFGVETDQDQDLNLKAKAFQSRGVGGAYRFEGSNWSVTPEFMISKLIHYQFGTFRGRSFADEGSNFSASLSYYFDEYRFPSFNTLPEYDDPTGAASEEWFGYSASISADWHVREDTFVEVRVKDLWNYLDMGNSTHRSICAEVGEVTDPVCSSGGAASGDDNPRTLETSIKPSVIFGATYQPLNIKAQYYWHDVYRNLSLEKRTDVGPVQLGAVATTKRQLGATVNWRGLSASYIVDDLNIKQVRDARIGLSYRHSW